MIPTAHFYFLFSKLLDNDDLKIFKLLIHIEHIVINVVVVKSKIIKRDTLLIINVNLNDQIGLNREVAFLVQMTNGLTLKVPLFCNND